MIGICNGFQILCEAGLLPGALVRNRSLRFICDMATTRVEVAHSPFTIGFPEGNAAAHAGRAWRRLLLRG